MQRAAGDGVTLLAPTIDTMRSRAGVTPGPYERCRQVLLILPKEIAMNRWIASFAIATFTSVVPPAFAGDDQGSVPESTAADASVELSGGAVAAGIGYMWGDGALTFGGQKHEFTIDGVSIVDVGATSISASGEVYNLNKLSDFDGNYVAFSAGAAVAGGGDAVYLRNDRGVVIKLSSTEIGLRFNLAASGVNIALKS
jgi:hypothetical protein